jgi:hypothetical protein
MSQACNLLIKFGNHTIILDVFHIGPIGASKYFNSIGCEAAVSLFESFQHGPFCLYQPAKPSISYFVVAYR